MGVSTDGILFYGFIQSNDDEETWSEAYSHFWDNTELAFHFEERTGLVFGTHCSDNYPMYYLAINDAHFKAARGYPETINPDKLTVDPAWEQKLRDYASLVGINLFDQKPGWYLTSYWG